MAGARWVRREVLDKNPDARLRVFAVWFDVLPTDSRLLVDRRVLGDRRVTNYWDAGGRSGRWFAEHVTGEGDFAWDIYFLYGPQAHWDDVPGPLVSMGASVIGESGKLAESIGPLIAP